MQGKFTDEDKQKLIDFLNIVADNATFELKTNDIITYFKLLAHMQQVIIPKINSNILEVIKVVEPEKPKAKAKGKKK